MSDQPTQTGRLRKSIDLNEIDESGRMVVTIPHLNIENLKEAEYETINQPQQKEQE